MCTCCHRIMYRKSVILCNKAKYTKANADVVQKVTSATLALMVNNECVELVIEH